VIFDIEGDPFWEPVRGLHFLFDPPRRRGRSVGTGVVGPTTGLPVPRGRPRGQ
jgi:hypothetical protein